METMDNECRISTGIDGLDKAIDFLRPGDTVVWQCEHISDYMYVATRFVTNIAQQGSRIVYIRFADHEEIVDTAALREGGCVFQDALFAGCENVYSTLMPTDADDAMADVIRVYDLGKDQAILYSEVGSQVCFLAKV